VVLVWASDRIARSVRHFLEVLDEFNRLNVEFVSFRENLDTGGPLGRAVVIIIGAIAELERNLIIERVRAGMRRARLEGRHIGRRPIDVDRVSVLRDRNRGHSLTDIAKAHRVSRATVSRLLKQAKDAEPVSIEAAQKGCRKAPLNSLNPSPRNPQFWRLTRYALWTTHTSYAK
jgi:DNA invertase Pin-like site-specific DNA recombinase